MREAKLVFRSTQLTYTSTSIITKTSFNRKPCSVQPRNKGYFRQKEIVFAVFADFKNEYEAVWKVY